MNKANEIGTNYESVSLLKEKTLGHLAAVYHSVQQLFDLLEESLIPSSAVLLKSVACSNGTSCQRNKLL